jgi:transketolase
MFNFLKHKKPKAQNAQYDQLQQIARQLRLDVIQMLTQAGSGHPASALGLADIFASLYFAVLNHQPQNPDWPERDYLLVSNGHVCPIWYASLARSGYFPLEELASLRQLGSPLQGHPHGPQFLPGIENTSGPLGQGISQACGLALGLKMDQRRNHVFCLMSDAEQQVGQSWEAYQLAAKYQLNNLTAIIDRNQIQISGTTAATMPLGDLQQALNSFGWQVQQIDGHDYQQIVTELTQAKNKQRQQPLAIIAHTTPGKGVSFMENKASWHGRAPSQAQAQQARQELTSNSKSNS